MPLPKYSEVQALNDEDLSEAILSTKKELFQLRFQKATGQLEEFHKFKHLRHRIAQLLTEQNQRNSKSSISEQEITAAQTINSVQEDV
ncbi:MAG: 50S ribosomal protein L29 [Cyanobacteria bacterium P01_H01_bin.15]